MAIDIENEILTEIENGLKDEYPTVFVTGVDVNIPSSFPCVSVVEADNYTYRRSRDSSLKEHHATVMYEINVYSNKNKGVKNDCKQIFNKVDNIMITLNFVRLSRRPISMSDATKYRIIGRYTAVVSEKGIIYGR